MWRPEGWETEELAKQAIAEIVADEPQFKQWVEHMFEAGADAMLRGLKGEALRYLSKDDWCVDLSLSEGEAGYIVFIQEEV